MLRVVRELSGAAAASLRAETPLMDAGVDSLAATELSSRLRSLTGVALSPTLVFEQPTPRSPPSMGSPARARARRVRPPLVPWMVGRWRSST